MNIQLKCLPPIYGRYPAKSLAMGVQLIRLGVQLITTKSLTMGVQLIQLLIHIGVQLIIQLINPDGCPVN